MAVRARAALSCAALVAVAGCAAEPPPVERCPPGATADPQRSARIVRLLEIDGPASARVARVRPHLCFGTSSPGLGRLIDLGAPRSGGDASVRPVALLDATAHDAELAARLAHLVRHAEEPPFVHPDAADGVACARTVVRAARVEALAARDEAEIRRRLGLGPAPRVEDVVAGYLARCRDR